jgi:DNA-binding SARP family transcriptional activator
VSVDGEPLDESAWRVGRSGSGVLRRYFRALLSAYPAALLRDGLADLLWPQSEGDKAVRNLYASTKDLRRVLAGVPGVGLEVAEGRSRLTVARNVRVT